VANYREAYSLYACTGMLFNHESPLRPERFVTQKIVRAAARIAMGSREKLEMGNIEKLEMGNIEIQRDWGWAPDYVDAMWKMLQLDAPQDFVIATGRTMSLDFFIKNSFQFFGLDYKDYLIVNSNLYRPTDIHVGSANPSKANDILDWRAQIRIETVIENMCVAAKQWYLQRET